MRFEADSVADLVQRTFLFDGETVAQVEHYSEDTLLVSTDYREGLVVRPGFRQFEVQAEGDAWFIGEEPWVDDVITATHHNPGVHLHGKRVQEALVLLVDGREIHVNKVDAMGELGRRLYEGMNAIGYAELLVEFHPYTSARCDLVIEPRSLYQFGVDDISRVRPPRLRQSRTGHVLTFNSTVRYRPPGSMPMLDILSWTVDFPIDRPATWDSHIAVEGVPMTGRPR